MGDILEGKLELQTATPWYCVVVRERTCDRIMSPYVFSAESKRIGGRIFAHTSELLAGLNRRQLALSWRWFPAALKEGVKGGGSFAPKYSPHGVDGGKLTDFRFPDSTMLLRVCRGWGFKRPAPDPS